MEADQDVNMITSSRTIEDEKAMENRPFVEKYRPDSLEEIISHKEIIETSKEFSRLTGLSYEICR